MPKGTTMTRTLIRLAMATGLLALPLAASAQSFSPVQRDEIGAVVRDYLLAHPEVLQEAMAELEKRQGAAEQAKQKAAVANNAATIFDSQRQVVLGNPKGDVTVVEFFDYNCGYCKRAMADMLDLVKNDTNLRFVLKEFPVLGDGSVEAAHVATAVRMQDKTGRKYLDFHQKLLGGRGEANKARALAAAKEAGIDMARLEKDMASDEVKASLKESFQLAEALGLNGTPSYVVGNDIVIGAVGLDSLKAKISNARCGRATC
jgi:protein-disulfide isomerase